jgi:hypothetical protein
MSRDAGGSYRRGIRGALQALDHVLFSRPAAAVAAATVALIFLGCMSISIGCRTAEEAKSCADDSGVLTQEGKVPLYVGGRQTIYYPIPYASPPNLELHDPHHYYDITEQKEGYFILCCSGFTGFWQEAQAVTWKARGVRCPPPAPPASAPPAENAPPPALLPPSPEPTTTE